MKNSPALDVEMEWVSKAEGETQVFRQQVIAWQMMRGAGNAIVGALNAGPNQTDERARQRHCLLLKAILVGYLYEMDLAFQAWASFLYKHGMFEAGMKGPQDEFRLHGRVLQTVLKGTRNHAFHFEDMFKPEKMTADEMVAAYESIDSIDIPQINEMWKSALKLGDVLSGPLKKLVS